MKSCQIQHLVLMILIRASTIGRPLRTPIAVLRKSTSGFFSSARPLVCNVGEFGSIPPYLTTAKSFASTCKLTYINVDEMVEHVPSEPSLPSASHCVNRCREIRQLSDKKITSGKSNMKCKHVEKIRLSICLIVLQITHARRFP